MRVSRGTAFEVRDTAGTLLGPTISVAAGLAVYAWTSDPWWTLAAFLFTGPAIQAARGAVTSGRSTVDVSHRIVRRR